MLQSAKNVSLAVITGALLLAATACSSLTQPEEISITAEPVGLRVPQAQPAPAAAAAAAAARPAPAPAQPTQGSCGN